MAFLTEEFTEIESFLGTSLPSCVANLCDNTYIVKKLNQSDIMNTIAFEPPFLKLDKVALLKDESNKVFDTKSLSMGTILRSDVLGHYNETIFLAMCGQLMASSAGVFMASMFPEAAPQVVEANGIKPMPSKEARLPWKIAPEGNTFFVETVVLKKKMQLINVRTTIMFENILYGVIEELKLVLAPRGATQTAQEFPVVVNKR